MCPSPFEALKECNAAIGYVHWNNVFGFFLTLLYCVPYFGQGEQIMGLYSCQFWSEWTNNTSWAFAFFRHLFISHFFHIPPPPPPPGGVSLVVKVFRKCRCRLDPHPATGMDDFSILVALTGAPNTHGTKLTLESSAVSHQILNPSEELIHGQGPHVTPRKGPMNECKQCWAWSVSRGAFSKKRTQKKSSGTGEMMKEIPFHFAPQKPIIF